MNSHFTLFDLRTTSTHQLPGRRRFGRVARCATTAAALASLAACGVSPGSSAEPELVGSTSQAVLGNEQETSCHPQDVPNIQLAFQWARIAVNSPAFAQCVSLAYDSPETVTPPNYGLMQIGYYNPCVGDPPLSGPRDILANTVTPNPVDINCEYDDPNSSEGGHAGIGQVPLSDTTSTETITLANALDPFQSASVPCFSAPAGTNCIADDAYAQAADTIIHEIMHQKGFNHTGYNPGNACADMAPSDLCGIPCAENPYYGSGVPYEVGECVRVVLEESMDHCAAMHSSCGPNGLQLVDSVLDSAPTCACVVDPASRSTIGVFTEAGATFDPTTNDLWTLADGTPGPKKTSFYYGAAGDIPVMGDWDGNGSVTPGIFRPAFTTWNPTSHDQWILSDDPAGATTRKPFYFGLGGDLPVVGDWDGDGTTTVGVFRNAVPADGGTTTDTWTLTNDPTGATANPSFEFGAPGDLPIAGDWDGNGTTTVGVFRKTGTTFNPATTDMWILTDDPTGATANPSFQFGAPGDLPVVGDWDGNRTTTVGVFRRTGTTYNPATTDMWILTNDPTGATANPSFQFGAPGDLPVVGAMSRL